MWYFVVNLLENCLYVNVLTPRFELGLTALFSQPSYFYEEPLPPLPVDIISRGAGIPFPVMSTFYYCFKEHIFISKHMGKRSPESTFSSENTFQIKYLCTIQYHPLYHP